MTFKEMVEEVIIDLDEDTTDATVIKKVKRYINRGYKELAKKENLEKTSVKTVINNRITVPTNCIKVSSVSKDGVLLSYERQGKYIYLNTDGNCELTYVYVPDNLEGDDDEPVTNIGNIEFILNFAKWHFSSSEGMTDNAQYYRSMVDLQRIVSPLKIIKTIDNLGGN